MTTATEGTGTAAAALASVADALDRARSTEDGLSEAEARNRLGSYGPNVVRTHKVSALAVLGRQLRSALLLLLAASAVVSFFVGERSQAVIIGVILAASVGLSFFNEYRAERAAAALHSQLRHQAVVRRDGVFVKKDVAELVPGDVVALTMGQAVPADMRLMSVNGLQCNESILSGESVPVDKTATAPAAADALADCADIAFMGTIVAAGDGVGMVFATGVRTEFGRIAAGLGERQPETAFQVGLRRFSYLLLRVALVLVAFILVINLLLHRPAIESVLFALAIAIGITPQLLPAVVSTSLALGSRRLAQRKVLVKRLVCIEDLGDIDVLFTDKTGTLTEGAVALAGSVDGHGRPGTEPLRLGLTACDSPTAAGANALDAALWANVDAARLTADIRTLGVLPFDHTRRTTTALIEDDTGRRVVVKGAPEQILARCRDLPDDADTTLRALFDDGLRVVAVASRPAPELTAIDPADDTALTLVGYLSFADEPKAAAAPALRRLAELGIEVKVATGDNPVVAEKVCATLGLAVTGTITGAGLEHLTDDDYERAVRENTVFARVSPDQKARLIKAARRTGRSVGFLGDGVNDALALHSADVGISVDTAVDVAKDAADVVLLEKDLGVLAAGVAEGRRIFANTIKYVLMGTSSNFGNMFSASAASAVLPFLPMLPSQVLLNNLIYDGSQLALPSDRVDEEQLHAPSHWDMGFIQRFMITFGPLSSLFDFLTFGILLGVLHAGAVEFRTGWFVESLATQTLIVMAIRTRRIPFLRSRPSGPLAATAIAAVAIAVLLPLSPLGPPLGFTPLPWQFYPMLAGLAVIYLVLVDVTKSVFYRDVVTRAPGRTRGRHHRIHRRAAPFSHAAAVPT